MKKYVLKYVYMDFYSITATKQKQPIAVMKDRGGNRYSVASTVLNEGTIQARNKLLRQEQCVVLEADEKPPKPNVPDRPLLYNIKNVRLIG